jgi:hypothetical protein
MLFKKKKKNNQSKQINNQSKNGWQHGSSNSTPAWQVHEDLISTPPHQKKKKTTKNQPLPTKTNRK